MAREHGTRSCYVGGCHRPECLAAHLAYGTEYRRRVQRVGDAPQRVAAHLALLREAGWSWADIAKAAHVYRSTPVRLAQGTAHVSRRVADAILGVHPDDPRPSGHIPASRLAALMDRLVARGWGRTQIGYAIGWKMAPQPERWRNVSADLYAQVAALEGQVPIGPKGEPVDEVARARDLQEPQRAEAQRLYDRDRKRAQRERQGVARTVEPSDLRWQDRARCKTLGVDPSLFFSEGKRDKVLRAQAVCAQCDVSDACLAFAVRERESGVWGGQVMTGGVRKRRRRGAA